MKTLTYSSFAC